MGNTRSSEYHMQLCHSLWLHVNIHTTFAMLQVLHVAFSISLASNLVRARRTNTRNQILSVINAPADLQKGKIYMCFQKKTARGSSRGDYCLADLDIMLEGTQGDVNVGLGALDECVSQRISYSQKDHVPKSCFRMGDAQAITIAENRLEPKDLIGSALGGSC